jgi:glycerol-1-phosphate dehydrogenase [NAD(P)+]
MTSATIDRLLAGTWPDPETGQPVKVAVKRVVIADSLAGREAACLDGLGLQPPFAVVSDPTTHALLGARVEAALGTLGAMIPVRLGDKPHADADQVVALRMATARARSLVAVGSGSINDLCKYTASRDRKRYVAFATAPSMNGYTSTNAAITVDGHKKSLAAVVPTGVYVDLGVLAGAPARMIRSGLGDSAARSTAQADWLLAHRLLDTPYRAAPFALLTEDEDALMAAPEALLAGDLRAMERLARTLILSGFGMTLCGSSHPASQAEHLISHTIEMMAPAGTPPAFHGEQVAVATLTIARLQERMLDGPPPRLAPTTVTEADAIRWFGPTLGATCWKDFAPKRLDAARASALNDRIAVDWDDIRARLRAAMRPATQIEATLRRAGAPTRPADLGLDIAFYRQVVRHARLTRDRFTILDLAAESGALDPFVDTLT